MNSVNEILTHALELPESERAALARQLLLSLEPEDFDLDSDVLWAAEIEARLALVERGQFTASDWRDALARVRDNLNQEPKS
jgi:putative addiction module component (TIGR02574 family)